MVPPSISQFYQRTIRGYGFYGSYESWDEAVGLSTGYDSQIILEKVLDSTLKVAQGVFPYERDSVLFNKIHHSWPLLASLLWISSLSGNKLNIVDYGGSLGSSYFQNRFFLEHLCLFKWNVVEQEHFVVNGKKYLENNALKFHCSINDCFVGNDPNVILLSSVLPYVERPYDLLDIVIDAGFKYVIIDRTPCVAGDHDRLTVQNVPKNIYPAKYPAWFLSKNKLVNKLTDSYTMVAEFDALSGKIWLGNENAKDIGMLLINNNV